MEVWLSHPIEVSMDLWTLVFSLLICFVMIHQRKVLMRNYILFFFWFMLDAVYMVLELESYRLEELMKIMPVIRILFVAVTVIILLVLAISIRGSIVRAVSLRIKEWLYIGANMIGILFFLLTGFTLVEQFITAGTEGVTLWPTLIGFVPTLLAGAADFTYFKAMHQRLRKSNPHMMYVFMIALFLAILVFIALKGTALAGGMLTIGMVLSFVFYMLSTNRTKESTIIRKEIIVKDEDRGPEMAPTSTMELDRLDEILSIKKEEAKEPEKVPASQPASENTTLLDLNPHFMYNTLNSVYYLIDQDPSQAKNTVEELSDYMKGKISLAKTDHMIPFENEMELVKSYLSIQELRYDDLLHVRYDLQCNGFLIPPLSLITLVEHAVNSVIARNMENGEIRIATSQDDLCNHISVAYSTKPGERIDKAELFKENPELQEIREKLEQYCRGAMEILPESDRVVLAVYVPLRSSEG